MSFYFELVIFSKNTTDAARHQILSTRFAKRQNTTLLSACLPAGRHGSLLSAI